MDMRVPADMPSCLNENRFVIIGFLIFIDTFPLFLHLSPHLKSSSDLYASTWTWFDYVGS